MAGDEVVEEVLDLLFGLFVALVAREAVPVPSDVLLLLFSLLGFGGRMLALFPPPVIPEFELFAALDKLLAAARPVAAPVGDSTGIEGSAVTREGFRDLFESDGDGDGLIGDSGGGGGGGGIFAGAFEPEVAEPPLFFNNFEPSFSLPLPPPPFKMLSFEVILSLPLNFPLTFEVAGEYSGASRDAHEEAAEVASVTSLLAIVFTLDSEVAAPEALVLLSKRDFASRAL